MGTTESKTWVFENVLFLDPNAPPFISQEEYERRQQAKQDGHDVYGETGDTDGKRGVKRFVPGQTKLRTRVFRVLVDVGGRSSEFQLKCSNDPMAFVLMDRQSRPLRSIPTGFVRQMQRKANAVTCRFGTSANPRADEEQIQMTFQFYDSNDCTGFVDSVKLVYGLYVDEYGVTKEEKKVKKTTQPTKTACPIHGNVPCRCDKSGRPKAGEAAAQGEDEEAQHSSEYPVTISGRLETGATLKYSDISALGRSRPPKAIEWRISYVPGREPEFGLENAAGGTSDEPNVTIDESLFITDSMVGKFIQVKVIRRVKDASQRLPVVYSLAMKGPITFHDEAAREVLEIITQPKYSVNIDMSPEDILVLFSDYQERLEQLAARQPFIDGVLTLTRQGITIDIPNLAAEAPAELPWTYFYVSRLDAAQSDFGNEEDLYLQIHLKRSKKKQVVLRLATPSEKTRNSLYHSIYFLKLQKSFKGFDRWAQDLERGNFSVFKQRYSKLWAATSFYDEIVDVTEVHPSLQATKRRDEYEGGEGAQAQWDETQESNQYQYETYDETEKPGASRLPAQDEYEEEEYEQAEDEI